MQIDKPFDDLLIEESRLAKLINQGCEDCNKSTAFKYLTWVAERKNLGSDSLQSIESHFDGFDRPEKTSWEDSASKMQEEDNL